MISKIEANNRAILQPIFKACKYDRVIIDSVLEGHFGTAHAIIEDGKVKTARLDSGAFTVLMGDTNSEALSDLINLREIYIVTPQNLEWETKLKEIYKGHIELLYFGEFDSSNLDLDKLEDQIKKIPKGYDITKFDKALAEKALEDLGNEYLFENFNSIEDFLSRGIGFCIIHHGKVVSAATSVAKSNKAIDIEIETHVSHRRKGLAAAIGAQLILESINEGIKPVWLAANMESEKLASKLGYTKTGKYMSFKIEMDNE